jgi:hypothetical protein
MRRGRSYSQDALGFEAVVGKVKSAAFSDSAWGPELKASARASGSVERR